MVFLLLKKPLGSAATALAGLLKALSRLPMMVSVAELGWGRGVLVDVFRLDCCVIVLWLGEATCLGLEVFSAGGSGAAVGAMGRVRIFNSVTSTLGVSTGLKRGAG